jgi:predicted metal-dependent peptidase
VAAPGELDQADDANGAAPATTGVERRVIDISTAAAIREAAAIGTVPAGLVAIAKQLLTPSKLPWKQILSSAIRRSIASRAGDTDVTYARRNRRRAYIDLSSNERIIRPGNYSPVPSLAVVRDTSGSMGAPQLNAVSVEIEGIAKQLGIRGEQLIVLDVDVEVAAKRQYRDFSQLEEVAGRGGTDMGVGIAEAAALRPKPNAIVVITDGMTPWPATRGNAPPTIAAIVGTSDAHSYLVEGVPAWIKPVLVDLR